MVTGLPVEKNWGFTGARSDYESARAVLFGVPMDFTTSYRPGTRLGPQRIREASYGLETYSPQQDADLEEASYHDWGDVILPLGNAAASIAVIEQAAGMILADGKIPVAIGGEHLASFPLVKAAVGHHPGLAVLHFDAHADLRDSYFGETLSHATVIRRVLEVVGAENLYQFGIRSGPREEFAFARNNTRFFPGEVVAPLRRVLPELEGRPVYVTLDIDVVDPAYAPGTGTPEPGGVSSAEILEAISLLGRLNVAGFDLVEVSPSADPSERTAILAAKILREALLGFAREGRGARG